MFKENCLMGVQPPVQSAFKEPFNAVHLKWELTLIVVFNKFIDKRGRALHELAESSLMRDY
ncbi:MAG: hypothetical protein ACRD5J_11520 [Nitrososphaeraceae archaeon]